VLVADEAAQATWVADRVLAHREGGLALKSQAVLFRTSTHSAALELELARRNIPFVKYRGRKVPRTGPVEGMPPVPALSAEPTGAHGGVPGDTVDSGHRPGHLRAPARCDGYRSRSGRGRAFLRAAFPGAGRMGAFCRRIRCAASAVAFVACRHGHRAVVVSA